MLVMSLLYEELKKIKDLSLQISAKTAFKTVNSKCKSLEAGCWSVGVITRRGIWLQWKKGGRELSKVRRF